MMISEKMNEQLNEQVTAEFAASHRYLAMACAFERMGLKALKARFLKQCDEERVHAMKIVRFIEDVGGTVTLDAIPQPTGSFEDVVAIAQDAVDGELEITRRIHDLVALAEREKDYSTRSFLQWFVDEQVEEVSTMTDVLHWAKLAPKELLQVDAMVRHSMGE
jgi:ferritin